MAEGSGSLDPGERPAAGSQPKACTACNTTKTPLWRGGPSGPMRRRMRRRPRPGAEEKAAILLMALSSGVIYG
ncbi:hypothetical protein TRIUR3_12995 [Triticum urartu]|uniref:Uncharacterized protein n=1 Tax=Triticum urartu TaxID=4572 RepID=M7YJV5_TRIUA|nr:hypothetical protein TRIUR3_12995 [Triticum urartu]